MVPFFVQFKCKLGQSYAVANALAEAEIASEIYSTAGDYDLLVKFYVDNTPTSAISSTRRCRSFRASRTPTPSSPSRRSAPARVSSRTPICQNLTGAVGRSGATGILMPQTETTVTFDRLESVHRGSVGQARLAFERCRDRSRH